VGLRQRYRLAGLLAVSSIALGGLTGAGPAAGPPAAGSLPIERVIGELRCNLDEALAATAKAQMRLTVTEVDLQLSALQTRSGGAPGRVEVPAIAAGIDPSALETGSAVPPSTHAVDIRFVPVDGSTSGVACQTDIGLLSVAQSAIAALSAKAIGTDRLVLGFEADFLISRSQDDRIGFVFLDRGREAGHLAVHHVKVELQLDRS
jgi:Trypsin-co-occurring domain 2